MSINVVVKSIISLFDVNKYVETGINTGGSLRTVYGWFKDRSEPFHMFAVDNVEDCCLRVIEEYKNEPHVFIHFDESVKFLSKLLQFGLITSPQDRTIFFLDAHMDTESPLRDEIRQVLKLANKPIIVIDDFKFLDKPRTIYGYSVFRRIGSSGNNFIQECGTEFIRDLLDGRANAVYHCEIPNEQGRGTGLIFVDWDQDELQPLLESLPLHRESLI